MNMLQRLLLSLGFMLLLVSSGASATACVGFTDVDSTSSFCPNVEWLRNRAITVGCTDATHYCPADFVSRLQMAAFMNRLGSELTPTFANGSGSFAVISGAVTGCTSFDVPPVPYPRTAVMNGAWAIGGGKFPGQGASAEPVYSLNAGATWSGMQPYIFGIISNPAGGFQGWPIASTPVPVPANATIRFGVQTLASNDATNFTVYCYYLVTLYNANGTSSPY